MKKKQQQINWQTFGKLKCTGERQSCGYTHTVLAGNTAKLSIDNMDRNWQPTFENLGCRGAPSQEFHQLLLTSTATAIVSSGGNKV